MLVGETLVLLHGLGSTIKDWDFQIPVLSEKFRLIILILMENQGLTMMILELNLTEDIFQLLQN
jgi:hypothetical protein